MATAKTTKSTATAKELVLLKTVQTAPKSEPLLAGKIVKVPDDISEDIAEELISKGLAESPTKEDSAE